MRILGIDLGSTSVKAVELDSAFGRFEIHEYHEQPVPIDAGEAGNPVAVAAALVRGLPKAPDRIVTTLPTRQVTFRNLQLPTKDKKAIQAGVNYELDDELPFSIENAAYDYSILHQAGSTSHVHVSATLRKNLAAFLEKCSETGFEPDLITTEGWAYRTLLNRIVKPAAQEDPVLVIDIGHQRTTFYAHWRGAPILTREIAWGGSDFTMSICRNLGMPLDRAEAAKLDHGVLLPLSPSEAATSEQLEFSKALRGPFEEMLREIHQLELTVKNLTHLRIGQILTTGGGSLLPGLNAAIEEALSIPAAPLHGLSSIATSGVTYSEQSDAGFALAAAMALVQVGPDRATAINFRKGGFAKQGHAREFSAATLRKPLMAVSAIVACLIVSLAVQSTVYQSRLKDTNIELEHAVRGFFGNVSHSAMHTYMANISGLKAQINREIKKQRELNQLLGPNPKSPLDVLNQLSKTIPKDTVVDLVQYQVGASPTAPYNPDAPESASLSFMVSSPQTAEKLTTLLNPKFTGLQKSSVDEVAAADGTKKWKVTFTGKPTEAAYGK